MSLQTITSVEDVTRAVWQAVMEEGVHLSKCNWIYRYTTQMARRPAHLRRICLLLALRHLQCAAHWHHPPQLVTQRARSVVANQCRQLYWLLPAESNSFGWFISHTHTHTHIKQVTKYPARALVTRTQYSSEDLICLSQVNWKSFNKRSASARTWCYLLVTLLNQLQNQATAVSMNAPLKGLLVASPLVVLMQ